MGESDILAGQPGAPVDAAWLEEFNVHIFAAAIERIRPEFDEPTWQAFDWTWLNDVKPQEAAQRLDATSAWVYKARYRVLQRLRSEIEFLTNDIAALHRPR